MDLNWLEKAVGLGLLLLFLFEFRDRQFRESWRRNPRRVRRNFGFALASVLVMALLKWINLSVQEFTFFRLMDWRGFGLVELPFCFLAAELAGWLLHYVKHRNRYLWKFHFQHHRENQYNLWLTAHTHALEVIVSGLLLAAGLSLLGFAVVTIEIYLLYYGFMKVFQHSARQYSFGALDRLFITPRYHRLHHVVNSQWNFGVTLTLFDILFQTALWPEENPASPEAPLGVSPEEAMPFGFWREMTYFLTGRRNQRPGQSAGEAGFQKFHDDSEEGSPRSLDSRSFR